MNTVNWLLCFLKCVHNFLDDYEMNDKCVFILNEFAKIHIINCNCQMKYISKSTHCHLTEIEKIVHMQAKKRTESHGE